MAIAKQQKINQLSMESLETLSEMLSDFNSFEDLEDWIEIEKSLFCRINSDCWDVKLKFFEPERGLRAKKVYLFTIDVSYLIPITLGQVRS